ncbi:probable pre-mRNA-splicing factor slt-11 [Phialocephala subalpina]|uniref:Probable pre-mRNA-splicing factor slt-11 n=1 Tax=Phialocephala subalpina TaxID=576137 RepID=A0A1L7XFA1_9HELO|nr:probable pre-mRNA-splicing factor slt-11 [Phialocephala subalpina]
MPPQIKQDLNRSGWETTDFPSVCENCLPDNPYVQMIKQDYGEECKICTRPFTVFKWKADRTSRSKRTNICLTCARLKNCCQCCMLDLSFGLPIVVRDAALKMVAPGPQSAVNREYYAQEHEKEIEEGRGGVEAYEKTDEKARELLRRLANSEPYFKKQRRIGPADGEGSADGESSTSTALATKGPGPIRTRDSRGAPSSRGAGPSRGGRGGARGGRAFPSAAQLPPQPQDILPPADQSITSLFVTGVEDDLPEFKIREFFSPYGKLRSLVCSHMSHCAFVNYSTREGAEAAAEALQGRAVIAGCPLRVQWGRPRPIGTMDKDERIATGREGRSAFASSSSGGGGAGSSQRAIAAPPKDDLASMAAVAAPPGSGDVQYASLAGN